MAGEAISVEDLLARQEQAAALRATVEAVPDRPDDVKVTPFVPDSGCRCESAVVVPKAAIDTLTTTDETHVCCGQRLMVVEVTFDDTTLASVFEQLAAPGRNLRGLPAYAMPELVSSDRIFLDTRTAATGSAGFTLGSTVAAVGLLQRCLNARTSCILRCHDPNDMVCLCHCLNDYARCIDPAAPNPHDCTAIP